LGIRASLDAWDNDGVRGTKDRKGGRYIIGTVLAVVGIWFAARTGRAVGEEPSLQIAGDLLIATSAITVAVQAFTDKRYPLTPWVKIARVIGLVGLGLRIFAERK
jgi:drug/metabolite transporter (DMT)-like permease